MSSNNKYADAKIYKLVNSVDDKEFVGSTITSLTKRKAEHKSRAVREGRRKVYGHVNSIG